MGQPLPFEKHESAQRGGVGVRLRVYRCEGCQHCPFAGDCLSRNNQRGRTITREPHEDAYERTAARMSTPAGRELYRQRPRIAETPFAILKSIMRLRQFLLRGLKKVKIEWLWAVTAFNLMKLVRAIGALRAEWAT